MCKIVKRWKTSRRIRDQKRTKTRLEVNISPHVEAIEGWKGKLKKKDLTAYSRWSPAHRRRDYRSSIESSGGVTEGRECLSMDVVAWPSLGCARHFPSGKERGFRCGRQKFKRWHTMTIRVSRESRCTYICKSWLHITVGRIVQVNRPHKSLGRQYKVRLPPKVSFYPPSHPISNDVPPGQSPSHLFNWVYGPSFERRTCLGRFGAGNPR